MVLFRRRTDYAPASCWPRRSPGDPPPRPDDIRVTHKGFDFRALVARLRRAVRRRRRGVHARSPALPWWLNSQVFARLRRRP